MFNLLLVLYYLRSKKTAIRNVLDYSIREYNIFSLSFSSRAYYYTIPSFIPKILSHALINIAAKLDYFYGRARMSLTINSCVIHIYSTLSGYLYAFQTVLTQHIPISKRFHI